MKSFYSWLESIHDKHLIIMRGLPGSGRTNKAKTLGIGGVIYSTDFDEIKNDFVAINNNLDVINYNVKICFCFSVINIFASVFC